MMQKLDYGEIIKFAWKEFDGERHEIKGVFDVSAKVSTIMYINYRFTNASRFLPKYRNTEILKTLGKTTLL